MHLPDGHPSALHPNPVPATSSPGSTSKANRKTPRDRSSSETTIIRFYIKVLYIYFSKKLKGLYFIMTSSNGNFFRVTDHLCREFTGPQWITHTKASDAELWCFLWSAPWINGWLCNREAGDVRCNRAHYDVTVMWKKPRVYITPGQLETYGYAISDVATWC